MTRVVVWGRRPPPVGGVTRCVQGLSDALTEAGVHHQVVDWREPRAARTVLTERGALHVHNVSSVLRLIFVIGAKALSGARTVVYFHSGTLVDQLRSPMRRCVARWGFRYVDEVWATNSTLVHAIGAVSGVHAVIVSPYSSTGTRTGPRPKANSVLLFVGYGKELYGLDLALAAKRHERLTGWLWTVVAYGDDESCAAVRERAEAAGCAVRVNLDADEVGRALADHSVLVRPTTTDGDAMIIREALAAGVRVVASDVVERPRGVELFRLGSIELAEALSAGGRPSSGRGLGAPIAEQVLAACSGCR